MRAGTPEDRDLCFQSQLWIVCDARPSTTKGLQIHHTDVYIGLPPRRHGATQAYLGLYRQSDRRRRLILTFETTELSLPGPLGHLTDNFDQREEEEEEEIRRIEASKVRSSAYHDMPDIKES